MRKRWFADGSAEDVAGARGELADRCSMHDQGDGRGKTVLRRREAAPVASMRKIALSLHPYLGRRHLRIGEAKNPGPVHSRIALGPIQYKDPAQVGFHGAVLPGDGGGRNGQEGDHAQLTIVTCNATAWGPLRRYLRRAKADIVLAQEHHLGPAEIPARSAAALRMGWHSVFAPAQPGEGSGWRAGVAIFARPQMGLSHPRVGGHVVIPHRAVAACVEPPGYRPTTLVALYLEDGKGVGRENLDHLGEVGKFVASQGDKVPYVIGGDFQCSPEQLAATGVASHMEGEIVASGCRRGTCRSTKAISEIDYFLISKLLAVGVDTVATVEGAGTRPHVPVEIVFKPRLVTARTLVLRQPPRISTSRLYGPLPPPPCWTQVADTAQRLVQATRRASFQCSDEFDVQYEQLYEAWSDLAELELEAAAEEATELPKHGLRGRRPQMRWRSVLPERPPPPPDCDDALTEWRSLANIVAELKRAVWACSHGGEGDGDGAEHVRDEDPRPRDDDAADMMVLDACQVVDEVKAQLSDIGRVSLVEQASGGAEVLADADGDGGAETCATYGEAVVRTRAIAATASVIMRNAVRVHGAAGPGCALQLADVAAQLDSLSDEVTRRLDRMAAVAKRGHDQRWREWIQANLNAGARNAHRFLRLPEEWRPTTLLDPDGVITAAPTGLIDGYSAKYNGLWNGGGGAEGQTAGERAGKPWQCGGNEPLGRPTPADIRAAARTFSASTAVAYDGFAMRHYEWLSDGALHTLADIIELTERTGKLPPQLGAIAMPLLGKPRGGHRAIATFVSLYRLWGRLRRDQVRQWEDSLQRPYFAAGAGKSPVDSVWRQAAQAEAAVAAGEGSATLLWDLAAFFESIQRKQLWYRARRLGFPTTVAAVAFNAYGAARLLSLGGVLSRPLFAENGIPAGCGFAMALTKAYVAEAFDRATSAFASLADVPPVLNVYVDDIAVSASGQARQIVRSLTDAHSILKDEIEGPLACRIEHAKAAVVASSRPLVETLRARFGRYAGPGSVEGRGSTAAANLGVDFAAGNARRTHGPNSRRAQRMTRLRRQLGRVARLRTVAGGRTKSIFVSGPLSAATYGAAVNGVTDVEALRLRRAASYAFTPRAKGRSLGRLLLIEGVPTWKAEVAVVLQYAQEVWRAVLLGPTRPVDGQLTLPGIDKLWRAVNPASVIKDNGRRRDWGAARGPISAAHLTLHRVGWTMDTAFSVTTDRGDVVSLTKTSPKLLQVMLHEAVVRQLQRQVGASIAVKDDDFADRRAAAEHIAAQLRTDKRMSGRDRAAYMSVACNAVMTLDRASRCGYLVSNLCAKCGKAPDTHFHRVWRCQDPEAVTAREAAAPEWLRREAERVGNSANKTMWETGLLPHPGDLWPRPSEALDAHYEWCGDEPPSDDNRGRDGSPKVHGKLYIDGSCTTNLFAELRRAASAVVQWSYEQRGGWKVLYPVPREVPQTPQAAEYFALGLARLAAAEGRKSDIASDCANVVVDAGVGRRRATRAGKMYAAINRENQADVQWMRNAVVRKVPAHVKPENATEGTAREDAIGNGMADLAAKEARGLHPAPPPALESQLAAQLKRARLIVRTIAAVTQVFPPVPRGMLRRPPKPVEGCSVGVDGGHAWTFSAGMWRCAACLKITLKPNVGAAQLRERCKGYRPSMLAASMADRGHHLARTAGDGAAAALSVLFCVKCGAYSSRRAYGLAAACPNVPTRAGRQALTRIRAGLQPWDLGRPAACRRILGQRPMAWDAARARFVDIGPVDGNRRRRTAAGDARGQQGAGPDAHERADVSRDAVSVVAHPHGGEDARHERRTTPLDDRTPQRSAPGLGGDGRAAKRSLDGGAYRGADGGTGEVADRRGHDPDVQMELGGGVRLHACSGAGNGSDCDMTIAETRLEREAAHPVKRFREHSHPRDGLTAGIPTDVPGPMQGDELEGSTRGREPHVEVQQLRGVYGRARPHHGVHVRDGLRAGSSDLGGRPPSTSLQRHHGPPQGGPPRAENVVMAGSSTDNFISVGDSRAVRVNGSPEGWAEGRGRGPPNPALLPRDARDGEHEDARGPPPRQPGPARGARPRSVEARGLLHPKRARTNGSPPRGGSWVMPWERPPQWLYLPHLTDNQCGPRPPGQVVDARSEDGRVAHGPLHRDADDADGRERAHGGVHDQHGIQGRPTSPGAGEVGGVHASGARHCQSLQGIRGPAPGLGALGEHSDATDGRGGGGFRDGAVRLQPDHTRASGEDDRTLLHGGRVHGRDEAREHVGRARERQLQRLAASNAHLSRSLADHEDRVAAKRQRSAHGDGAASQPSAAERMRALRQRIAAKGNPNLAGVQGGVGDRPRVDAAQRAQDGLARHSDEECKMHFVLAAREAADSCNGRQRDRSPSCTAAAAAAAADAWHGCGPADVAGEVGRQLRS